MTTERPDSTRMRELTLPYRFKTESAKGRVEVEIKPTPNGSHFTKCGPYVFSVPDLNRWSHCGKDYTIAEVKEKVACFGK